MKEFNVAQCPVCGSWNTENVNPDFRRCNVCGVAWDRVYQYGVRPQIHTKKAIIDYLRQAIDGALEDVIPIY